MELSLSQRQWTFLESKMLALDNEPFFIPEAKKISNPTMQIA